MRSSVVFHVVAMAIGLSACDAWPTRVINKSPATVSFSWHLSQYQEWSAPVVLRPGQSVVLARAHYVADFTGISIIDGPRTYTVPQTRMADYRRTCSRSVIDRLTTLGDCDITYLGEGRVAVTRVR